MSIGEITYRIKNKDKDEVKKMIENIEFDFYFYDVFNKSSILSSGGRSICLRNVSKFLEKIISVESFDEEYKERARKLLEIGEELTEKSNNMEESQKQVKLEKTDSYIELYNLRKKERNNNEMKWGESTINTKVDNELLNDDIKGFIDAVMPIKEQAKKQYNIETRQDIEERRKKEEERKKRLEERGKSSSTELIPAKNKSIFKILFEKIINSVKTFKLSFFSRKKDDNSIIDVEYREVKNPTGDENTRKIFVNRVEVNRLEEKENANNGKYSSGEHDR